MNSNEARVRRLRQIRAALQAKTPNKVSARVAENLHSLLQEAVEKGKRKRDIANAAWQMIAESYGDKRTDSLLTQLKNNPEYAAKQLYRLTLAPEQVRKLDKKLDKKPANYASVAKAWAKALGRSEDEALLRLFGDTDFARNVTEEPDDNYDPWDLLANGLRDSAQHVIRLHRLDDYYRKVMTASGRYDARYGYVVASQGVWINQGGLALRATCSDEVEPVPSVRLARRLRCEPVGGRIWIEPDIWAKPASEPAAPYSSHVTFPEGAPIVPGPTTVSYGKTDRMIEKDCIYRLWLDIRLAAGPAHAETEIAPLIEIRTNLEVEIDGKVGTLDNPFTDGADIIRAIHIKRASHRVYVDCPPESLPRAFSSSSFDQTENTYFAWASVSAETLREVLDDSPSLMNGYNAFEHTFDFDDRCSNALFPSGVVAEIERRLRSRELDLELSADATRLALLLEQHRTNLRASFDADMNRLSEARLRAEKAVDSERRTELDTETDQ